MSAWWWMVALAILQTGAAGMLAYEGKPWLGAVYFCYALSNLFLIGVQR